MGNENRDIAPVLLKFGVALALSFGGVLYSLLINKRSKASQSPKDPRKHSDCNKQGNSRSNHLRFDPLATDKHSEKVKEESQNLKKQNEDLTKQLETLEADKCADVEELVYLRWINACLRYELRNYQPGPGKTTARDLSKNLSPKSEEKAKQLILEYANKEDQGLINLQEIDSDRWSNSQASIISSCDFEESCVEDSLAHNKKNKFFGKLMRILRGKDKDKRNHSRNSSEDMSSCWSPENQRLRTSSKKLTHRHSDSSFYNQIEKDSGGDGRRSYSVSTGGGKSELVKYAEALKDSRPMSKFKAHRRTPSLTFL